MREPDDKRLLSDMQRGNRVAMETFFRRYSPYLYAVALRYLSDTDDANDLLHDAFIKIFTSIKSFKADSPDIERSLKAWSARIVANLALNRLRDAARINFVSIDDNPAEDIPDSDEDVDADTLTIDIINRLIEDLPPNYRTVFNLFAIEGFSHREIARMLGISESVSATQYHRARAQLKKKILQYLNAK